MSTVTEIAHCGACTGEMVLDLVDGLFRYICLACGYETPLRATTGEAAEDVVWARASTARKKQEPRMGTERR